MPPRVFSHIIGCKPIYIPIFYSSSPPLFPILSSLSPPLRSLQTLHRRSKPQALFLRCVVNRLGFSFVGSLFYSNYYLFCLDKALGLEGMASSTTSNVYIHVIEDVISKVRDEFINNGGPGESILKELQAVISIFPSKFSIFSFNDAI